MTPDKKTPKGKIVYGGGGIMPDVFVALDTADITDYYSNLIRGGHVNSYSLEFVNTNREQLKKKYTDVKAFISNFNTDILPGTCTATIPALLESQRGSRGWYYTVSFVETATGTESGMSAFYATGSAKSSFTVSFPLTLYGKTFTSKLYIRNDGQSWSGDYLPLQDLTPNTTSFTILL